MIEQAGGELQMPSAWTAVIVALLSGSTVKYGIDLFRSAQKARAGAGTPVEKRQREVDASILTVSRARDELAEDLGTMRSILRDERDQHSHERAVWAAERESYRREIASLEEQIRRERAKAEERYDILLNEVASIRKRYTEPKEHR